MKQDDYLEMNQYVYKPTADPDCWTVGYYESGVWVPESDHRSPLAAAERVNYLNGNSTGTRLVTMSDVPMTKRGIQMAADNFANAIMDDGRDTPLSAYMKLRALADIIEQAARAIQPYALEQAERDPGETLHGVGWQVRNGRTTYDYSHDAAWGQLQASERSVAEMRKAREAFLRGLGREMVDPATGEYVSPAEVKSVGAPVLALTFPKE